MHLGRNHNQQIPRYSPKYSDCRTSGVWVKDSKNTGKCCNNNYASNPYIEYTETFLHMAKYSNKSIYAKAHYSENCDAPIYFNFS